MRRADAQASPNQFASVIPLLPPLPATPNSDSKPILVVVDVESIAVTSDPATPGIALRSDPFDSLPILPKTDSVTVDDNYLVCGSLLFHRTPLRNTKSEPNGPPTTSSRTYPALTRLSIFGITDPPHLFDFDMHDEEHVPTARPPVVRGQWSMMPSAAMFHAMVNGWQWDLESVEERKEASTEKWVGEVRRYSVDPSHLKGMDDPFPSTVSIDWPLLGPPILRDVKEVAEGYWQSDHVEDSIPPVVQHKLPSPPDSPGSAYTVPSLPSAEDVRTSLLFSDQFPPSHEDAPFGSPDTSAYASPPPLLHDLPPLPADGSCPVLPGPRRKSKTIELPSPSTYTEGLPPRVVVGVDSKPTSYFCPRSMYVPPTDAFKSGFYDSEDSSSADEGQSESDEDEGKSEGGLDVWTV